MIRIDRTAPVIACLGLIIGFGFYLLDNHDREAHLWWSQPLEAKLGSIRPLETFWFAGSLFLLLLLPERFGSRALLKALVLGLGFALLAWINTALVWNGQEAAQSASFHYWLSVTFSIFVIYCFVSASVRDEEWWPEYKTLVQVTWDTLISLAVALIFSLMVLGVLKLWGELFNLIGISFFEEIFEQDDVLWPLCTGAFALALYLLQQESGLLHSGRGLLRSLMRLLASVFCIILVLFLIFLPFTGIAPLLDTGISTGIVLTAMALSILLLNTAMQDTATSTLAPTLRWTLTTLIICLPIFSAISVWTLWLRINAEGLLPGHYYGIVYILITGGLALAYSLSVLENPRDWSESLYAWNQRLALPFTALALATNLPLINAYDLSAEDQIQRYLKREKTINERMLDHFDAEVPYRYWGAPAERALEALKTREDPAIKARTTALFEALSARERTFANSQEREETRQEAILKPEGLDAPLLLAMIMHQQNDAIQNCNALQERAVCGLLPIELGNPLYGQVFAFWTTVQANDHTTTKTIVLYGQEDGESYWIILGQLDLATNAEGSNAMQQFTKGTLPVTLDKLLTH